MAKKDKQEAERAVEMDSLAPDLKKKARELGFREKVTLNGIAKGVAHERFAEKLAAGFVAAIGLGSAVFLVLAVVGPRDRRGSFGFLGAFGLMWAGLALVSVFRAKRRQKGLATLEEVVRQRLGR